MDEQTVNLGQQVSEGEVLAGKYRVERVLGAGGMGVVVAALHLELDERVAIKFLLPGALCSPEAVARFAREARASVKIKSEHVARTIDVGKLESGAPYMVMEFLEGQDLSQRVREHGPLPIDQAVELTLQACEAVADAHALGIVHRDLKPANLFVIRRSDGTEAVKVLDFGISKVTGGSATGSDVGMTKTTAVMGSPLYMSPEQMESARNVDARTDIWALGASLFELLTGSPPFTGDSITELCAKVLNHPTPPLLERRPDAPEGLQTVINRCMEKNREHRYANVAELAVALVEFGPKRARHSAERVSRVIQAAGLSASALALPPSSGDAAPGQATATKAPGTMASWGATAAPAKTRSALLAAAVAVGGLLVVVVGVVLFYRALFGETAEPTAAGAPSVEVAGQPSAEAQPSEPEVKTMPSATTVVATASAATAPSVTAEAQASTRPAAKPTKAPPTRSVAAKPTPPKQTAPAPAPVTPATTTGRKYKERGF